MSLMKISDVLKTLNPFSPYGDEDQRTKASRYREEAEKNLATARARKAVFEDMYSQQKSMSDALRTERRKNHFSEMFQQIPTRSREG